MASNQEVATWNSDILCSFCRPIFYGKRWVISSAPKGVWKPSSHHVSYQSFLASIESGCIFCFRTQVYLRSLELPNLDELLFGYDGDTPLMQYYFREDANRRTQEMTVSVVLIIHYFTEHVLVTGDGTSEKQRKSKSSFHFSTDLLALDTLEGVTTKDLDNVGDSTGDEQSWKQAMEWRSECLVKHKSCATRGSDADFFPSRVLDISDDAMVRLHTRQGDEKARYATLSHCWGQIRNQRILTAETVDKLTEGIPVTYLPKTFREAVEVAKRMRVNYLWIDSLCIFQDSIKDWQHEAALMEQVYSNGHINIMATDSRDTEAGLFRKRDPRAVGHYVVKTKWNHKPEEDYILFDELIWTRELSQAPLNKRGWVLQERILSPRAIHFGEHQLFWECKELDACEAYPKGLPNLLNNLHTKFKILDPMVFNLYRMNWYTGLDKSRMRPEFAGYDLWARVVLLYTSTSVTHESDKLVAVSGLAKRMRSILNDRYLAGLWFKHLPTELLWQVTSQPMDMEKVVYRPNQYRAPSWSWASIEGSIGSHPPRSMTTCFIEILEAEISPRDGHDDTGELMDGFIRLKGTLIDARIHRNSKSLGSAFVKLLVDGNRKCNGLVLTDLSQIVNDEDILALPVCYLDGVSTYGESIYLLMLQKVEGKPSGYYQRHGICTFWKDDEGAWESIMVALGEPPKNPDLFLQDEPGSLILV